MNTPKMTAQGDRIPLSLSGLGVALAFPFLAPRDVPPDRVRLRHPDGRVEAVSRVPDWYWWTSERFIGKVTVGLRGGVYLYTFFTCAEEDDGSLYHTVVVTPDDPAEWTLLARARSEQEAQEIHGTVRSAWWVGEAQYRYPNAGAGVRVPRPDFQVPPHPLDDL